MAWSISKHFRGLTVFGLLSKRPLARKSEVHSAWCSADRKPFYLQQSPEVESLVIDQNPILYFRPNRNRNQRLVQFLPKTINICGHLLQ